MTGKFRHLLGVLAIGGLAACGNAPEQSPMRIALDAGLSGLTGESRPSPAQVPESGFLAVAPTLIATAQSEPAVGLYMQERNTQALLSLSGATATHVTWLTGDRISVTLSGGTMLARTSGLGHDLNNADFSQTLMLMAQGAAGQAERTHTYLTADFQQDRERFTCDVRPLGQAQVQLGRASRQTLAYEEACTGDMGDFTNRYWLDTGSGQIVQAVQWVHPQVGKAHLQLLNQ